MSNRNILMTIRGISPEELLYLEHATKTFTEEQTKHFVFIYHYYPTKVGVVYI